MENSIPGYAVKWVLALFASRENQAQFDAIKANSPFSRKTVIVVSYGTTTTFGGDITHFMAIRGIGIDVASSIIKNIILADGHKVHDWDDYLVVFESPMARSDIRAEVFWVASGKNREKPALERKVRRA